MFEITIIPTLRREVKLQRNLKNRDFFTKEQDDNIYPVHFSTSWNIWYP